jgi:hypothetical protein
MIERVIEFPGATLMALALAAYHWPAVAWGCVLAGAVAMLWRFA